jgi:nucleoside-diphosphate-sugar epimerase
MDIPKTCARPIPTDIREIDVKVLVTGAGGFVGRQLVHGLLDAGHEVIGIDSHAGGIPAGARAVEGDLGAASVRAEALGKGCDALVHLATVPGGAAEADPAASRRINVDAMYDLLLEASALTPGLRVAYASSIAVYGDPLPAEVDDATPLSPRMIYGGHKAMMEHAVALFSNRGLIDGVTVRLPGILARPKGPSGMKSAFMSNLFHALKAGEAFTCPVSAAGTIWAESLECVARNFVHALTLDTALLPPTRAVTLPALRVTMGDLAAEIARQCGVSADLVSYEPNAALEAAFAAQPPLSTPAAEKAGFAHDGDLAMLARSALRTLS